MNEVNEKLLLLQWSWDDLVKHLDTVYQRKLRKKETSKEYFKKNKSKIYKYHKDWRTKNPGYLERKRGIERNRHREK